MTSRIQEDGGGTESKWADIDDDEDDWAPETIEWTDGTKTSITHNETTPPTAIHDSRIEKPEKADKAEKVPEPALPPAEPVSVPRETPKFAPKPTTSVGPNPTVLRLGANAERQAKSASGSPRGTANERNFPTSTSPAPPPSKSPWAPLPPVDKVSPITPPVQVYPQPRPLAREHPVADNFTGPPPPKEIAADDFNRSWRDVQSGAPRELYNSRSGRYEPVAETRKGVWRGEQRAHAPSLLQRPAHNEPTGPAEPSAAFQTNRSSAQDGPPWTRRRTSSNVSGGSGMFGRRMSAGRVDVPPKPGFEGRRGSQVNGMVDRDAAIPEFSHARYHAGPGWQRRSSLTMNDATGHAPGMVPQPSAPVAPEQSAGPPKEDPVAMQERIMKEKRMEARQRRLEQEEKEEAAKRERIRLKLEALGPAPDKPKRKEAMEGSPPEGTQAPAAATTSQSPPKPPVPEPTGEPKQYGMMKVHHPDSVKRLVAAHERERTGEKAAPMPHHRRMPSPGREPKPEAAPIATGPPQTGEPQMPSPSRPLEPKVEDQSPQWRPNLNVPGPYSPWSSNTKLGGTSPSLTNPWKPLSNDRTLGNGIFEQSQLGGFPARDIPLRGPLGFDTPSITPASQPFPATTMAPPDATAMSPLPSPEVRHATYDSLSPIGHHPGPIGPPSSQPPHWQQDARPTGTVAWNNFHAVAAKREAEENERLRQEMNAMRDTPASLQVTFNETWRQVRTGEQAGQRQVIGITRPTDSVPPPNPLPGFDHPVGGLPFADTHARPLGTVPVRSSRFFPHATEQPKRPAFEEQECMRSPSPPPPEEVTSHPVFTGFSDRPLVHLPAPKPIVKLPPKVVAPPPPPPTFASMAAAPPRMAPHHLPMGMSWQEKINGLFGKKTMHEKRGALEVASASKEPLDVQLHAESVPVSLPQNVEVDVQTGDGEMSAQQVEEEELMFEDREAGSLPVVRVPNMAPPAAWLAAPRPSQSRLRAKNLKSMQVHSIEPYSFGIDKDSSGYIRVSIRLPGAILAKSFVLPKKAPMHHPRNRGFSHFKPRKGPKPRDGSGNFNNKKPALSQQANGGGSSRPQTRNASWGTGTPNGPQ